MTTKFIKLAAAFAVAGLALTGCGRSSDAAGTTSAGTSGATGSSGAASSAPPRSPRAKSPSSPTGPTSSTPSSRTTRRSSRRSTPNVHVTFQALTDYEGESKIRMNTERLRRRAAHPEHRHAASSYPTFFEPLGNDRRPGEEVPLHRPSSLEGKDYGIAITGNANGFVYNKKVWAAGRAITSDPTTPDAVPRRSADRSRPRPAAIPYYTNYQDGWPLTQWSPTVDRRRPPATPTPTNELARQRRRRGRPARTSTSS